MMRKHQTNHISHLEIDLNKKIVDVKQKIQESRTEIQRLIWKLFRRMIIMLGLFAFINHILKLIAVHQLNSPSLRLK